MKIDRTKYTAHYENGIVVAQWISVEMALDGANGESPLDALDRSQALVEQWYKSKNLPFENNTIPPGPPPAINIQRTTEDEKIADTIKGMYACTELDGDDGLLTFKKIASANRETQSVFDIMLKRLAPKK